MKIVLVKINRCSECPYCNEDIYYDFHCEEADRDIDDADKIPAWCPLDEGIGE